MSNFCVFRCSTKFLRKHLCLSLLLIKLQVFMLKLYWKKRLRWRCFLMNFARCLRQFFYRTPPGDCLCSTEKYFTNKIVKSPLKKKKKKMETAGKKSNDTRRIKLNTILASNLYIFLLFKNFLIPLFLLPTIHWKYELLEITPYQSRFIYQK